MVDPGRSRRPPWLPEPRRWPGLDRAAFSAAPLRGPAQVIEDDGARLRFRHDLIRDAIYEETPAGQAVAILVADGLTNPQIGARLYISRRTVQTHLVGVFAKLDIASRAQLTAQVARRQ